MLILTSIEKALNLTQMRSPATKLAFEQPRYVPNVTRSALEAGQKIAENSATFQSFNNKATLRHPSKRQSA